jgi:mannose/fructose/N-acetylgalactosamine-specific phosphotransferase system component IID
MRWAVVKYLYPKEEREEKTEGAVRGTILLLLLLLLLLTYYTSQHLGYQLGNLHLSQTVKRFGLSQGKKIYPVSKVKGRVLVICVLYYYYYYYY